MSEALRAQQVNARTEQIIRREVAGLVFTLARAEAEIEQLRAELAERDASIAKGQSQT